MTFYFYDLETSGINARAQRIMQFAGQRTDEDFNLIGEPHNWLVKLTDEILPDPEAVLVTGITPQKTIQEGYSEVEFLKLFNKEVLQPDTIICGFNSVRFDDEFMRATLWRNFFDPYEWQWQDGRSRWDILDTIRMIRALRPEGIKWPFENRPVGSSEHGKIINTKLKTIKVPSNRLELLTKINGLGHENAHDALSDVYATISVAKLLKQKQPKIFEYLLSIRDKKKVLELISAEDPKPFVYTSGRYSSKWEKTTVAITIADAGQGSLLVYDLRQDPLELTDLSDEKLTEKLFSRDPETEILPIKTLRPNACPAVAPLGVLDKASQERLNLSIKQIETNYNNLINTKGLIDRIKLLCTSGHEKIKNKFVKPNDPDLMIYEGFINEVDKTKMRAVRAADKNSLSDLNLNFNDERLEKLLPRYKARNFPESLTKSEAEAWLSYRSDRLKNGLPGQLSLQQYVEKLSELSVIRSSENDQFLLEELKLYAESIIPEIDSY